MNRAGQWSIEYSHTQDNYHLGKTSEMLRRNIKSMQLGEHIDYICIGFFHNKELALDAMLDLRRKRMPGQTIGLQF